MPVILIGKYLAAKKEKAENNWFVIIKVKEKGCFSIRKLTSTYENFNILNWYTR